MVNAKPKIVEKQILSFSPDDEIRSNGKRSFLNGNLPGSRRGGLSTADIEQFKDDVQFYGSAEEILRQLKKLSSFNVCLEEGANPRKCIVSLFNTGVNLKELLKKDVQENEKKTTEVKMLDEQKSFPEIIGRMVWLKECVYLNNNTISGVIDYEGKKYPAIIPPVSKKVIDKHKRNNQIYVKVKSNDGKRYIVQIK